MSWHANLIHCDPGKPERVNFLRLRHTRMKIKEKSEISDKNILYVVFMQSRSSRKGNRTIPKLNYTVNSCNIQMILRTGCRAELKKNLHHRGSVEKVSKSEGFVRICGIIFNKHHSRGSLQ